MMDGPAAAIGSRRRTEGHHHDRDVASSGSCNQSNSSNSIQSSNKNNDSKKNINNRKSSNRSPSAFEPDHRDSNIKSASKSGFRTNFSNDLDHPKVNGTTSFRHSSQIEEDHIADRDGPRTSLVSGESESCSYHTTRSGNRALADTSQGSGASSVRPIAGGGGLLHHHHTASALSDTLNFGGSTAAGADSSSVVSNQNRVFSAGDVFSRRVTLGGGAGSGGAGPSSAAGMVSGGAAGLLSSYENRRNSLSSLSLMDDIFGKRSSMGLGSTAATALSSMGAGGGAGGGGSGYGGSGMGGGNDMDSTAMMSVVGSGGANMGGGNAWRRGSLDSTTAALDAAIFDLTRRRYSMANSSLVGGAAGAGGLGSLVAGGGGAATINSLTGGERGFNGLSSHHGGHDFGSGNYDGGMGGTGGSDATRRTSLDEVGSVTGGGSVGGGMGSGMDYDNNMMGNSGLNMSSSGMGNNSSGSAAGMMDQFQPQRVRNITSNLAARQQQLQAQQRELERRQRELEQQRRDLIASMQQRKLMMQSQGQSSQFAHSFSGGNNAFGGNESRYDNMLQQGSGRGGSGGGGMNSNFNDPLTGPFNHSRNNNNSSSNNKNMGGFGGNSGMNNNNMNNSDHSSRGGMGQGTHNSGGGGSHSSGSQQWWICQVCNTKAFASHDEALAHEAICIQQQQQGSMNNMSNSNSRRGQYGQNFDSQMGYMSSPQSQRNRASSGRRINPRNMDMSGSNSMGKFERGGMDTSMRTIHTAATSNSYEPVYSKGPFATLENPLPLAMPTDKDWLTPLHCFVRKHCVEVFCASEADVAAPSKGKRKPIQVGQIGIRCPHCHPNSPSMASGNAEGTKLRERGSVYYPTTIASIYNATMNLLQRHLHSCSAVPKEIMTRYETLKSDDARSGTSKKYWIESALSIGLVDTEMGIRFSAATPPPLPQLTDSQKDMQKHMKDQTEAENMGDDDEGIGEDGKARSRQRDLSDSNEEETSLLTAPEDKAYSTAFSYHLLSQMKPCVFTEADRLGKRKGLPPGFRGLACRFCFGGYGSGRFFPSSIKTLSDTSKTLNVLHNHMIRCRKCPAAVRETLEQLRGTHDEERAKMKFGSQKAFFARIWDRLHGTGKSSSEKASASPEKSPRSSKETSGGNTESDPESPPKTSPKRKAPPSESSSPKKSPPPDSAAKSASNKSIKSDKKEERDVMESAKKRQRTTEDDDKKKETNEDDDSS